MEKIWLEQYPPGVPAEVRTDSHASLAVLLDDAFARHRELPALRFMGRSLSYGQLDQLSRAFAAWLQAQGLVRGDRVAVMLPNVPQFPVAVAAILRAGCVVVNVDPLNPPRELEHQLKDSGAKAIVVLENDAPVLQQVADGGAARKVVVCATGDLLGLLKGALVNHVERKQRKPVPAWGLPAALRFPEALKQGRGLAFTPPRLGPDDIAVLQYTGGTTGVSKGAVLLHRNLVANLLHSEAWFRPALAKIPAGEQVATVAALPLHHVFGFSTAMLLTLHLGGCMLLVADARDVAGMLKALAGQRFHSLPAVDTLFEALARHPDFDRVDWSHLRISVGGGMPVQQATARLWLEKTGCPICEGYGLSETSPVAACNPVDATAWTGSIGVPVPSTEIILLDEDGARIPPGPRGPVGEIAIRGPQVMAGYWQRPDETARAMTADGFLRTGDLGLMDERGFLRIVDRKKDMIVVSGFDVVPNEVEGVIARMPGVLECAAVGVPDPRAGEAVKAVIVRRDPAVTEADVRAWCEAHLTGYKRPRVVEFRAELPKTPVGKVLRRELRG